MEKPDSTEALPNPKKKTIAIRKLCAFQDLHRVHPWGQLNHRTRHGNGCKRRCEAEQILSLTVDIAPGLLSDRREG
jgi:hypothetical protein